MPGESQVVELEGSSGKSISWMRLALNGYVFAFLAMAVLRFTWACLREREPQESLFVVLFDTWTQDLRAVALLAVGLALVYVLLASIHPALRRRASSWIMTLGLIACLGGLCGAMWLSAPPRKFDDISSRSGLLSPKTLSIDTFDFLTADLDRDGDQDLLVNHHHLHPPTYYLNRGDGTFEDVSKSSGIYDNAPLAPPYGEPDSSLGGIRLWHDWPHSLEDQGQWHIRWDEGQGIRGEIEATSAFVQASAINDATQVEVLDEGKLLRFASDGLASGFDFQQDTLVGAYRVQIEFVGEGSSTRVVRLGAAESTPRSSSFSFEMTDRHGASVADFNRDGHLDVYIACGGRRGQIQPPDPGKDDLLFMNTGEGRLERAEGALGANGPYMRGRSSSWIDLDADGRLELYVSDFKGKNRLYRWSGDVFAKAEPNGLDLRHCTSFEFLDLDQDGDQDFFALRPVTVLFQENGEFQPREDRMGLPELALPENHGLFPEPGFAFEDVDADGDRDLVLGGHLYLRDGDRFKDQGELLAGRIVGCSFGDYDNDGDPDLFLVRENGTNRFLENHEGQFRDATRESGLFVSRQVGVVAGWFDANGDGFLDLFVVNRTLPDWWSTLSGRKGHHHLFLNRGNDHHWLQVKLLTEEMAPLNRGASVRVKTGERIQSRDLGLPDRYRFSRGISPLHFGLGSHSTAEEVQIRWPSGEIQTLFDVESGQVLELIEP